MESELLVSTRLVQSIHDHAPHVDNHSCTAFRDLTASLVTAEAINRLLSVCGPMARHGALTIDSFYDLHPEERREFERLRTMREGS